MISKRYLTSINLTLASILVAFGLYLAWDLFRGREIVEDTVAAPRSRPAQAVTPVPAQDEYAVIVNRDLWKEKFDAPEPERIPTPPPPPIPNPKLKLIGTIMGTDPSRNRAIIEDQVNRTGQRLYGIGDVVAGVKVVEIYRSRVVLDNNGNLFELASFENSIPVPEVTVPMARLVRKIGDYRWQISRSGLYRYINDNVMGALKTVGCRPYYPPGAPARGPSQGYEIVILPKDHIAARLGVKQGDIILSVDDEPIIGKVRALELLKEVNDREEITVKVKRADETIDLVYEVQEELLEL
jgi:type II secretory pathway component PulC